MAVSVPLAWGHQGSVFPCRVGLAEAQARSVPWGHVEGCWAGETDGISLEF